MYVQILFYMIRNNRFFSFLIIYEVQGLLRGFVVRVNVAGANVTKQNCKHGDQLFIIVTKRSKYGERMIEM